MERIKVTRDTLNKALYEGVIEAMLPDSQEQVETNDDLESSLRSYGATGDMFIRFGEHLKYNIIPEIKTLYSEGLKIAKQVFKDGLNLGNIKSWSFGNKYSVEIPIASFDGYKSYLENESHNLSRTLEEFTSDITDYEESLSRENYEKMKEAFFNNKEWLISSIDDELDSLEDGIKCRYSTIRISYATTKQAVWIDIEYPIDFDKCDQFINGGEE